VRKELILGGGCFWCMEAGFRMLRGVLEVVPGYAGGSTEDPDYRKVCRGNTGHAEVVKVVYDDSLLRTEDVLAMFFALHDPTTPNRQGNDVGTQYRSVILYQGMEQKKEAEDALAIWGHEHPGYVPVTELQPLQGFHPAEDYHQRYYERNRNQPYCRMVIEPKLNKLISRQSGLQRP